MESVELAAFDLDGTILRGDTVCEAIARELGRLDRMRELERANTTEEIRALREELAEWYHPYAVEELSGPLPEMRLAPGAREAFDLFRDRGVDTAIVSITWEFAVEHFAEELGADHYVGTRLRSDGTIGHFWGEDKPVWVRDLAAEVGTSMDRVVSVGDSSGDAHMLRETGRSFFVGQSLPDGLNGVEHVPDADLSELARRVLATA